MSQISPVELFQIGNVKSFGRRIKNEGEENRKNRYDHCGGGRYSFERSC